MNTQVVTAPAMATATFCARFSFPVRKLVLPVAAAKMWARRLNLGRLNRNVNFDPNLNRFNCLSRGVDCQFNRYLPLASVSICFLFVPTPACS